jgi:hypothetical protein
MWGNIGGGRGHRLRRIAAEIRGGGDCSLYSTSGDYSLSSTRGGGVIKKLDFFGKDADIGIARP